MPRLNVKPLHVFILVSLFLSAWLYTEVTAYMKREDFYEEVSNFMIHGDRFTAEEGQELKQRVEALEKKVDPGP